MIIDEKKLRTIPLTEIRQVKEPEPDPDPGEEPYFPPIDEYELGPYHGARKAKPKANAAEVLGRIIPAQTILDTEYPEPRWAVKGLLPEGTTFIVGPPKLGKSVFCLNLAIAVASGGKFLSTFDVDQGRVLYLALEDGERRIQERLMRITAGKAPPLLEFVTRWPKLNEGGTEALLLWIERNPDARMIIIDTLKKIRAVRTGRESLYDADYDSVDPLTALASQRISIPIVHHSRKMDDPDPLATVSGSFGLTGAANNALIMKRSRNKSDATMSVVGRDVEEQELALEFKPQLFLWSSMGKSSEVRRSGEREDVLTVLAKHKNPLSPNEIALLLGRPANSAIRTLLMRMRADDEIAIFGNKYQLPTFEVAPTKKKASQASLSKSDESDATKSSAGNGIAGKRHTVTAVRENRVTSPSLEIVKTGDAVTLSPQSLQEQELSASLDAKSQSDASDAVSEFQELVDDYIAETGGTQCKGCGSLLAPGVVCSVCAAPKAF